jgi:hypothetical protein
MGVRIVSAATATHGEWLIGQLQSFAAFYGTKRPLFPFNDQQYVRDTLETFIRDHLFLVAERDAKPVGFIAGVLVPHPFNPAIRTLIEQLWWLEDQSDTRAAVALVDAFVAHGETHADLISFSLMEKRLVGAGALRRRGFWPAERQYIKEVG